MLRLIDIVVYAIVLFIVYLIVNREISDLQCSDENLSECDGSSSMALGPGRYEAGDDAQTIMQKIAFTARYEENTVVWRRAFLTSTAISFILLYLILKRVPDAREFLIALLVCFAILYLVITIYRPLVSEKAVKQIDELLNELRTEV